MSDNGKKLLQDEHGQSVLQRNAPGMGSREEDLEVQIGDVKESVTVKVSEENIPKKSWRMYLKKLQGNWKHLFWEKQKSG